MFARQTRLFVSRFRVRLVIYHSLFLIASFGILFVSTYWAMSTTLTQKDHEIITAKENEIALQYDQGGLKALRDLVANQGPEFDVWIFVRLESPQGKTLFQHVPQDSSQFPLSTLEGSDAHQKQTQQWIFLPKPHDEDVLEILSTRLKDGSILQVGKNSDDRETALELLRNIFIGLSIPILLLSFLGSYLMSRRALLPIRNLVATLHSLDRGEMSARVPEIHTGDELGELVRVFNHMVDRIQELIRGMRGIINDVAHDLKTPMTRFRSIAEKALKSDNDIELYREALIKCVEDSDRILTLIDTTMEIAEAKSGTIHLDLRKSNLKDITQEVIELYTMVAEEEQITLTNNVNAAHEALIDKRYMIRALANLLDNSIKYNHKNGNVWVSSSHEGNEIVLRVKDDGIGIPPNELPKIWGRLYRVDKSRSKRGLGLGLTLVRAIVEAHGGTVTVESRLTEGSTFHLRLPVGIE